MSEKNEGTAVPETAEVHREEEKKESSSLEPDPNDEPLKDPPLLHRKILGPSAAGVSPLSDQHPGSTEAADIRLSRTPERRLSSEDLFLPQLRHSYMGVGEEKRGVNVTAETTQSEISEFSPAYSDRRARDEPLEDPLSRPAEAADDDSSSNDDSSYFADPSNLPSPKSGRHHYSQSSLASATNSVNNHGSGRDYGRESDASLSLSDDSDDGMHMPAQAVSFPQHPRGVPELYPHPITRMHSVSSLVSTNSQNSTDNEELKEVVEHEGERATSSGRPTPSGRKSPVMGRHPPSRVVGPFFQSPTSNPSPPTILNTYPSVEYVFPHPQPHLMTPQELERWENSGGVGLPYGATSFDNSAAPSKESVFAYSEDSEGGAGCVPQNSLPPHLGHGSSKEVPQGQLNAVIGVGPASTSARGEPSSDPTSLRASGRGRGGPPSSLRRGLDHASDSRLTGSTHGNDGDDEAGLVAENRRRGFKVYWQRWVMLVYMSVLNLLSDWTCYSVAPIALLTREAFGSVNAERLVVVFLTANAVATACEPIILSRLGLRRTVLFGALLLMIGSVVKSGGMPPIIHARLDKGHGEWRVYLGFFLVGLSQPLYQCTPALLSASWFPEKERTMATGIALNANQVGIGFAFIFGTLLVTTSDDIPAYFGLLSVLSTLTFLGVLIQFDDAPPTPPSDTARVVRGSLEVGLPSIGTIGTIFRNIGGSRSNVDSSDRMSSQKNELRHAHNSSPDSKVRDRSKTKSRSRRGNRSSERSSSRRQAGTSGTTTRRRTPQPPSAPSGPIATEGFHGLAPAPSPANWGPVGSRSGTYPASSPAVPGNIGPPVQAPDEPGENSDSEVQAGQGAHEGVDQPPLNPFLPPGQTIPGQHAFPHYGYGSTEGRPYHTGFGYPQSFSQPVWDPYYQQYVYFAIPPSHEYQQSGHYYYSYQNPPPPAYQRQFESPDNVLPSPTVPIDVGAEPVLTITPHHLDIDIRDDQILLSTRACLSRPGFIHALVAFTVSGIVINTLSTFMDYLVRLNGAGREYTGIVGGSFQFVIMISSLIVGQFTDKTRAYYSVTVGMLVLGAFGLAECGVSLDSDSGAQLRWSLVIVAALVGPLQPVSTELGVDVVYPLSENTVLVIQQLFSNLLSAMFIPCFKAFKDFGVSDHEYGATEKPEYTFSFYMLIVIHAAATVFFATFNGRYLRYEHELEKKAEDERRERLNDSSSFYDPSNENVYDPEHGPLIPPIV